MMLKKAIKENRLIFLLLMFIGILLSIFFKNENFYDLGNYHYYNGFAFLHDRSGLDVVPASVNTFFNPIMDLPLYFLIQYFNDSPNIFYAFQGIWCGLFLFVLYKICQLFFEKSKKQPLQILLVLFLTVTAQATMVQIGSSTNEISVAFFILWGLYVLLKMIKFCETQRLKKFFAAGLIMGIGLGLKQTVIVYCLAAGLTLICCYKYLNKPLKSILFFAVGGLIGYLIINGYFMYKYWILYANPFFPFLNGIFHSPYFFDFNYKDTHFLPSVREFFIYPFLWNIKPLSIAEVPYYDFRLTLYYILPVFTFVTLLFKKELKNFCTQQKTLAALYIFIFLSFFAWMSVFSIMRYAVVIEATGAVLFIKLCIQDEKQQHKKFLFGYFILFFLLVIPLLYNNWGSAKGQKHIDLMNISLPENSLVKIYGVHTSFIIPEISKGKNIKTVSYYPKCTGLKNNLCFNGEGSDLAEYGPFLEQRKEVERTHNGPVIYIFRKLQQMLEHKEYFDNAESLNFVNDLLCKKLKNNLNLDLTICVPPELKEKIFGD